jgi:hypothetical protein
MTVLFFVIQENEKKERRDKFLFKVDLAVPLMNGTTHPFEGKNYIVVEQSIIRKGFNTTVNAYCHELILPTYETN